MVIKITVVSGKYILLKTGNILIENKVISDYYDYTLPSYFLIYHGKSYGLHHGYHSPLTRCAVEEILNTNRVLAETAKNKSGEIVSRPDVVSVAALFD